MKNKSGRKKPKKTSEIASLDDPDDDHKIEVAWNTEMDKKMRRIAAKKILLPGVSKGITSLYKAMESLQNPMKLQSKQEGGTCKVIFQID